MHSSSVKRQGFILTNNHLKLKNIYELSHSDEINQNFENISRKLGNQQLLWHGSDNGNLLSILREGLFVPPITASNYMVVGRLFGDGVYFSDQSTKALNYSFGYWNNNRSNRCFMFLADVVMGNAYFPNRSSHGFNANEAHFGRNSKGQSYDSIFVKGGTCGVMNNEKVVWNTDQIRLKYLIEFNNY